jgi:AcrR family transcriptional regulator
MIGGGERRGRGRPRAPEASEAIINATISLLAEGGVEAVTSEAIADRAGVGRPSIYRRWPSIGELIREVMTIAGAREVPVPDTGSLRSDLTRALNDLIGAVTEPLGRASVALIAYATTHPDTAHQGVSPQENRRRATRQIVERAVERGEVPASIGADLLLDLISAPVWMTVLIWQRPVSSIDPKAIVDAVLDGMLSDS